MKPNRLTTKQRERLLLLTRWLAAGAAGFVVHCSIWLFLNFNLEVWKTATLPIGASTGVSSEEYYEARERSFAYQVKFCGVEVARDDNTDGRDTRDAIDNVIRLVEGVRVASALATAVIVAGAVDVWLRIQIRRRIEDQG